MKDQINEKLQQPGLDKMALAAILWPESTVKARRVMVNRLVERGIKTLKHEQWVAIINYFTLNP